MLSDAEWAWDPARPRRPASCRNCACFEGRLYVGHGDVAVNTVRSDVIAYDPATGSFRSEFTADARRSRRTASSPSQSRAAKRRCRRARFRCPKRRSPAFAARPHFARSPRPCPPRTFVARCRTFWS